LWGELLVEAVLGNVHRTGVFVRRVGCCLGLTEDALLNIDLAVEERPRSPDCGGYPRRPVHHGVLDPTLWRANVL